MDGPMAAHTIAHYFFAFLFTTVNILPIATLAILQYNIFLVTIIKVFLCLRKVNFRFCRG